MLKRFKKQSLTSSILLFWSVYWLFNFLDKIFGSTKVPFWAGKNRIDQLVRLFGEINLTNYYIIISIFIVITIWELLIFYFYHRALLNIAKRLNPLKPFLRATVLSILLFTSLVAGDVVFGERGEVLEHTIYAILSLTSYLLIFPNNTKS